MRLRNRIFSLAVASVILASNVMPTIVTARSTLTWPGESGKPLPGSETPRPPYSGNPNPGGSRTETQNFVEPKDPDIHITVEIPPPVANTVVLNLAKFNLRALPYEMELMKENLKLTAEYQYGDLIHFHEDPIGMNTNQRPYIQFEQQLIRDGIVRHPNDVWYRTWSNAEGRWFSFSRGRDFHYNEDDLVERTQFLGTLGRVSGVKDSVNLVSKSSATTIADTDGATKQVRGRQELTKTPYFKQVHGNVDVGESIVLVDYTDAEYSTVKMDNIYKPYLNELININVIDESEIVGTPDKVEFESSGDNPLVGDKENGNYIDEDKLEEATQNKSLHSNALGEIRRSSFVNGHVDLIRHNYDSITVSTPPKNPESSKDWNWEVQETLTGIDRGAILPKYNYTGEYELKEDITGTYYDENTTYEAQVPQLMKNEKITHLDALMYIYKYLWYHEKEFTLNEMEVNTVTSLYGIQFAGYSPEEQKALKYLIAKGIVDPNEDNLEILQESLTYEDMVKYIFRLNYEDKRFDFKNLALSAEDIKMANEGYVQDQFRFTKEVDTELTQMLDEAEKRAVQADDARGRQTVFLEIPNQQFAISNYVLTDWEDRGIMYETIPIKMNGKVYARARVPRFLNKTDMLVLRGPALYGNQFQFTLTEWEDGGIYDLTETRGGHYRKTGSSGTGSLEASARVNHYLGGDVYFTVDPTKATTYKKEDLFVSGALNPKLSETFELKDGKLYFKGVNTVEEFKAIATNIVPPPNLSANDVTFMGYTKLSANGIKVSMIRDLDMEKLGVKVLEDNVLHNSKLDTYGYLDPRTHTLYYGNTVVRYEPGTLMVEGIPGKEATLYNLDIVKTMLSKAESNGSIANEIITLLPDDQRMEVINKSGEQYDSVYMHPTPNNANGDWWLNSATLGKKNSNIIYFRDMNNGNFSMYINYRAKNHQRDKSKMENDNGFEKFIDMMKTEGNDPHTGVNPIFQSILGFKGNFTSDRYNYGITLLHPSKEGGGKDNAYNLEKQKENFYKLMNMFTSKKQAEEFIGSLANTDQFGSIVMPDSIGSSGETVNQFRDKNRKKENDIQRDSVFLGGQEVVREGANATERADLPAKFFNNNLYFRFTNAPKFSSINISKYRFLDTLTFLYKLDSNKKEMRIIEEKINYDNAAVGYIPLEDWPETAPISKTWKKEDKIVLRLSTSSRLSNEEKPYIFDRIKAFNSDNNQARVIISVDNDRTHQQSLLTIYNGLKDASVTFKNSMEGNILDRRFRNNSEALKHFLGKSVEGSNNILGATVTGAGAWKGFLNKVPLLNRVYVSEKMLVDENKPFKMKKGKTYIIDPLYLIPSGTQLVNVGKDDYFKGEFSKGTNNYKLETSINPRPRVELNDHFDLVNQSLAQLMAEVPVKDIKMGSTLQLPTGIQLLALGNSEFMIMKGEEVGKNIDSEEVLLWKYLSHLSAKSGSTLNTLNGVEELRLPTEQELSGTAQGDIQTLVKQDNLLFNGKVAYTNNNQLNSGKVNWRQKVTKDKNLDGNANMFPVVKLNGSVASSKLRNLDEEGEKGLYILRDVGMSVDGSFVDYLRDGIINVNSPMLSGSDLGERPIDDNAIEIFDIHAMLTLLSKMLLMAWYSLPLILILVGLTGVMMTIFWSTGQVQNFFRRYMADETTYKVLSFLTFFSAEDMMNLRLGASLGKSVLVTVVGIVWWSLTRGHLLSLLR